MTEFRVERPIWSDTIEIYGRTQVDGKPMALVADGVKVIPAERGELWPRFLSLPMLTNDGQSLFDALWAAGFRPNSGESSVAHVKAMDAHLQDMRTLVFKSDK